jgi:hypothetical protein
MISNFNNLSCNFEDDQVYEYFQNVNFDAFVKSQKINLLSFRPGSGSGMTAKPESSHFNSFWTPAPAPDSDPGFAGVTGLRLFTTISTFNGTKSWKNRLH